MGQRQGGGSSFSFAASNRIGKYRNVALTHYFPCILHSFLYLSFTHKHTYTHTDVSVNTNDGTHTSALITCSNAQHKLRTHTHIVYALIYLCVGVCAYVYVCVCISACKGFTASRLQQKSALQRREGAPLRYEN